MEIALKKKFTIIFNAPTVIIFTIICFIATILGIITQGYTDYLLFSVYRAPLTNPLTYLRFVGHVFGHSGFEHFMGNIMYILLLGPLLEEKYGSKKLAIIIFITAVITGLVQFTFFSNALLGASGVVFMFIILSSVTGFKGQGVPITFILVAVLYIGKEIYSALFLFDNVSQITHIVGGIVGAAIGFFYSKKSHKN